MITQLNITIPQETNCKFLSIWDRSFYNPNLPVDEPTMLITIPGFKYAKKLYPDLTAHHLSHSF